MSRFSAFEMLGQFIRAQLFDSWKGQSKQNINENINEKLLKINQLINFIGQLSEEEGTESVLPWYYWAEIYKFAIRFDRQSVLASVLTGRWRVDREHPCVQAKSSPISSTGHSVCLTLRQTTRDLLRRFW